MKKITNIIAIFFLIFFTSFLSAKEYHIGASLLTQQHPFYISLADSIKQTSKDNNINLSLSIANQDLNKQISDIEDFITKKVDLIILSPVDSKGVQAAILKAKKANIPVITVDIPSIGAEVVSHIATNNYEGGVMAGKLMGELLNGQGSVGIIDYPMVQSVVDRVEGFKKGLSETPNIKIVSIQTGITRAEALIVAQNMLQAYPNLDGIFGFGDDAALSAVIAAKSLRNDNIKIIGFDGMEEARKAVDREKTFVAVIQQYPDKLGEIAILTAIDYLDGKHVEPIIPVTPGVYTGTH